jgi:putative ABC transport system substrate-binding protein
MFEGTVRRRDFFKGIAAAAAWPFAARAQGERVERVRNICVLMGSAGTALDQANVAALFQRLDELGWQRDRNTRAHVRWWTGAPEQMRSTVAEMLTLSPEVIVVFTNLALAGLKPLAMKVPIVFVGVGDPVGSGFITSLNRHQSALHCCCAKRSIRPIPPVVVS